METGSVFPVTESVSAPLPISRRFVHVAPPSVLMAANMPGLVLSLEDMKSCCEPAGSTAISPSVSVPACWLTSTTLG